MEGGKIKTLAMPGSIAWFTVQCSRTSRLLPFALIWLSASAQSAVLARLSFNRKWSDKWLLEINSIEIISVMAHVGTQGRLHVTHLRQSISVLRIAILLYTVTRHITICASKPSFVCQNISACIKLNRPRLAIVYRYRNQGGHNMIME